jgi:hypothetical protein
MMMWMASSERGGSHLGLTVVVPTHSTRDLTLRCLSSIESQGSAVHEIIVVDDHSRDDTVEQVRRRFPQVQVIVLASRSGFTMAANRGLDVARGQLFLLLNSDTEVLEGGLSALREAFETDPALGVAGGQLFFPNGEPQWSGGDEPGLLWSFALASGLAEMLASLPGYRRVRPVRGGRGDPRPVEWVTGAALACRREVWREVGPLDQSFRFYCQDLDFCLRARRAGWGVEILPRFQVSHVHGATIDRAPGSARRQNPELLWTDLVRWARSSHGTRVALRYRNALGLGGHLRLTGHRLRMLVGGRRIRGRWSEPSLAFRRALRALRELPP